MRELSATGALRRAGVTDPARAARLLADPALAAARAAVDAAGVDLVGALGATAEPDLAVLALVRLAEAGADVAAALITPGHRERLLAVLGASAALGDMLVAHPDDVALLAHGPSLGAADGEAADGADPVLVTTPEGERAHALAAVGADPAARVPVATVADGVAAVRRTYRSRLLQVAAADLTAADPLAALPVVAAAIADVATAALDAALAVARQEVGPAAAGVRLAVIGMGKAGGRELNYVSDVDVVYVAEPAVGTDEDDALAVGARLAAALARVVSAPGPEPALWPVDTALRPEGKDGPLVRTLASHLAYYRRWASTWEFQALLKARPVAGDLALGEEYRAAVAPLVWTAVERTNFVEDARAMRRRVEAHVPAREADRQLKLGAGGLRDVEFTVQLLQLVHGRTDPSIRSATTLTGLDQLAAGGYVGRDHAAELAAHYRFLRLLEHRIQLYRLARTHLLPADEPRLRRLARSLGVPGITGAAALQERWRQVRRQVRQLHEDIFYRPLLPATARLGVDDVALDPAAARARLAAIGYLDPDRALRHLAALTDGVSRRAAIQRQLLPVMLGWFAAGSEPDQGLLAFRKISDTMGTTHWYLKLLRDSGAAAERLARLVSTSRYVAEGLARLPEAVAWLDDDADLVPRGEEVLRGELAALQARRPVPADAVMAARYLRRRELLRAAVADVLDPDRDDDRAAAPLASAAPVTAAAETAIAGALSAAVADATAGAGLAEPPSRYLVVAVGRLGGQEMGYASDADVLFVHDPLPGADPEVAARTAHAVAASVRRLLGATGPEPPLAVDADLRPEGRNGPLVRTLGSYAEYYQRWVEPWERQALLRARPVAGDTGLGERFTALVDPLRYPEHGLDPGAVRELRRVKARVEAERMARGVPPTRHLKLGPGGLADVEWTVQLLQLGHAGAVPELRTPGTMTALRALAGAGIVRAEEAARLAEAWVLASRIRDAVVLGTGRPGRVDVLPHDPHELGVVARVLGVDGGRQELEERYLRAARRARAVVEDLFYG